MDMMPTVEALAAVAARRGASGVRAFLFENRAGLRELLAALAAPTLLDADGGSLSVGLRVEALPLAAQREIWSAFVQWRAALPTDALRSLVERFLSAPRSHQADAVSLYIAKELRRALQDDNDDADEADDYDHEELDPVDAALSALVYLPTLPKVKTHAPLQSKHADGSSTTTRKRRRGSQDQEQEEPQDDEVVLSQRQASQEESKSPTVALSPETETRVNAIATQLAQLGSPDAAADQSARAFELAAHAVEVLRQVMNQVLATQQDNEALFQLACTKLQLRATSDDALFQITSGLMDASWSSWYAAMYLDTAVLPRVLAATSVISRVLLQTILLYAKPSYTGALADGLLVPLLSTPSIGPAQCEAATRLLREKCVPTDQIDALLQRALELGTTTQSESSGLLTNEPTILVFQNALNMKPTLSAPTVELLVSAAAGALAIEKTRAALCKSPKFASLVFTLVTKYSAQCRSHAEELQGVAQQLTSVMAKSVLRAIQKLNT